VTKVTAAEPRLVVYWTCTEEILEVTRKGLNTMKALWLYARYALSALTTLAFSSIN
jgi:hypothetical protein